MLLAELFHQWHFPQQSEGRGVHGLPGRRGAALRNGESPSASIGVSPSASIAACSPRSSVLKEFLTSESPSWFRV
jgi:hypothetical protein